MIRTDRSFSDAVAEAVRAAERGTAAEIVVVVAARSGSYLDLALIAGAAIAAVVLAVALFAPAVFPPLAVALEVPVAFGVTAWLLNRTPGLLSWLVPRVRARGQVERAAAEYFLAEAVHGTNAHTGLLLFVSVLEERATLVPDLGLQGRVPEPLWMTVRFAERGDGRRVKTRDDLLRGIAAIGGLLRERAPEDRGDVNELPDAPRIVP
jgi:putative membrane protein